MPLTIDDLSLKVDLPKIPDTAPVAGFDYPCLRETQEKAHAFAEVLGFRVRTTVSVPHGVMAVGDDGQVEVFTASGAIRGRNVARLAAFEDERREWPDVEKIDGPDGVDFALSPDAAKRLTTQGLRLLAAAGIERGHADARIVLERWAQLDEKGNEIDAGPGRATVALSYAVGDVPLLGPGAKTNLHFDPGDRVGELARFFHVNRATRETGEVRTAPFDVSVAPLLAESWTARGLQPGEGRIIVTGATYGLLALPAHLSQLHALPVLAVEGVVQGDLDGLEEIHFARYLPLYDEKDAAERGFAPVVEAGAGEVKPVLRPSRKDAA